MKKGAKIILIICILLTLIFFIVDYLRVQKQEKPIFCILKDEVNDGGTKIYLGLGYKVIDFHTLEGFSGIKIGTWFMDYNDFSEEMELIQNVEPKIKNDEKYVKLENIELDYDLAKMVEDKCYILGNSNTVYHIEELDNFIKNVENDIPDEIRIVQYTVEGQPILTNLEYTKDKFILKIDNRRDGYATTEDRKIITNEYDKNQYTLVKSDTPKEQIKLKTYYSLDLKEIKTNKTIPICSYVEVKKVANKRFEIKFNEKVQKEEITKILGKEESNKYDYNIYSYKGTVDIIIEGEKMPLRDALINNKITIEEILKKANKDVKEDEVIFGSIYSDGGSTSYIYHNYQILKCNTLSGNKDLYIGVPSMNINDINKAESI